MSPTPVLALAVGALAAGTFACGDGTRGDPIGRLARELPASAQVVISIDPPRLRGTWIGSSVRAVRALVPAERACVVDVALAGDHALVAELPIGRVIAIATARPVDCKSLSQVAPGVWLATLDGASAPVGKEPTLADRPDFRELRARLRAPIAAVAPDGDPPTGVLFASAAMTDATHGELAIELDTAAHAEDAERWLRARLDAAAAALGDSAGIVRAIGVRREAMTVSATLVADAATAGRDGPIAAVAAIAVAAARRAPPVSSAPTCAATPWPVTCRDGTQFELRRGLRSTVEAAVHAAHPAQRVAAGQPAGVRLGAIADDSVLTALGLRAGDAVIAVDGRRLDTVDALDDLGARLRWADAVSLTIERDSGTFQLRYAVIPD